MATVKFTKDVIVVCAKEIKMYADSMLESLKQDDTYEALSGVEKSSEKIEELLGDIDFRLNECDEF